MLPVSKFAESQMYEHKASDPIESTKQAIEMSHLFGHYDTKSFENFLNTFNKYSMMQPGDSSQLQQTIKYLAPTANTLHMKEKDTMALAAVANTLGLSGSHGGTNAADMIMRMVPGISGGMPKPILDKKGNIKGYKKSRSWKAMEELGFIDKQGNSQFFNKDGSLRDLDGMLKTMIELSKTMNPMKLTAAYHDIFGIQGGRAASIFSNPRSMEQLEKMRGQLGKTKSMEQINNDLQNTPEGQMNLFKSNSMSLMLRVGQQLAIMLNPAIKSLNKFMGGLLKFSEAHPGIAKIVGDFALLMVGGKLLSGVIKLIVGNVQMANAAFKMFKLKNAAGEATKLAKGLKGLGTAFKFMGTGTLAVIKILGRFSGFLIKLGIQAARWAIGIAADWLVAMGPVGWIIAGVTAIIAAGILMWNKNFLGFRDGLTRIWKDIKQIFNTYIHAWADYGKIFVDLFTGHFGDLKKDFMKLVDDLLGIFKPVTDIFSTIGKGGKNLWNWAKGGSENLWNWATGGGHNSGPTHKSGNTTNHYNINVNSNNGKQFAQDFHKETRKMNMNTSPYPTFGAMP
jgi:TP901 family phage tail tape measure protein